MRAQVLLLQGTRMILWAHKGHIADEPASMGQLLRRELGKDYLAIGFAFNQGAFQAGALSGKEIREFILGSPAGLPKLTA
jgi:erythromycin esterase